MTYEKFLAKKFNYDEDMVVLNYNNKDLQNEYNEKYGKPTKEILNENKNVFKRLKYK